MNELERDLRGMLQGIGCTVLGAWDEPPRREIHGLCPELHPRLTQMVDKRYPNGLYQHQAEAIKAAVAGKDIVVSTSTASGKTVCFAMPVLNQLLVDREAVALFFYPTKALAGDQLQKLQGFCKAVGLGDVVYRFDGDTDLVGRKQALAKGRILICTPDVLHATMLKRNREAAYASLFSRLRFVVLDECHVYSGSFGSNMAFLLRRLRQVCRNYGSEPQFLAASATVKDPGRHMQLLTGREFTVIGEEKNGSPTGGRLFVMAAPEDPSGQMMAVRDLVARLVDDLRRFLVFFHSRKAAEQQFRDLINRGSEAEGLVMSYRSGFEAEDRRKIEEQLRSGELLGVYSTSALELGVDLPDMEICIMAGVPSSAMGFWQRAGRVGRNPGHPGVVVVIPSENPIDQYYRQHPDRLLSRPLEDLAIHLDNRELIISHIACARLESGTFDDPELDESIFGEDFVRFTRELKDTDTTDEVLFSPDPHAITNLRCIDDRNLEIILTPTGQRHGTITWSQTLREAYPQAIYLHMGVPYRVERILTKEGQIRIRHEQRQDNTTSPTGYVDVKARHEVLYRKREWGNSLAIWHTGVSVTTATTGYRERHGSQWFGQVSYPSPFRRRVDSEGVWLQFGSEFGTVTLNALNSLAHAIVNVYGIVQPCDVHEIATHSIQKARDGSSQLYVFDTTSGGLAISSALFDRFEDVLDKAEGLIRGCPFCSGDGPEHDRGCPSCLQVPRWYEDNDHLSKSEALELVNRIRLILEQESRTHIAERYQQRSSGGLTSVREESRPTTTENAGHCLVWKPGGTVRTRTGAEGTINGVAPAANGGGVMYQIRIGQSILSIPSAGGLLAPVTVEEEIWCMGCGTQGLAPGENCCPVCGREFSSGA